jgi:hypothetical protein
MAGRITASFQRNATNNSSMPLALGGQRAILSRTNFLRFAVKNQLLEQLGPQPQLGPSLCVTFKLTYGTACRGKPIQVNQASTGSHHLT